MSKPKILYVDDDSINLLLFEANLEKKYTVLTANSVQSGLDILSNNPDIKVLMSDLKLPVMNGLEFIKQGKAGITRHLLLYINRLRCFF